MIQDDVEDHIEAGFVSCINQGPQLLIRILRNHCKPWLGAQEIVDAVAVIAEPVEGWVLEDRAEPDCAGAEIFEVMQAGLHARERAALIAVEVGVVPRLVAWRCVGPVEAVDHEKVDPNISPISWRGREPGSPRFVDDTSHRRLRQRPCAITSHIVMELRVSSKEPCCTGRPTLNRSSQLAQPSARIGMWCEMRSTASMPRR